MFLKATPQSVSDSTHWDMEQSTFNLVDLCTPSGHDAGTGVVPCQASMDQVSGGGGGVSGGNVQVREIQTRGADLTGRTILRRTILKHNTVQYTNTDRTIYEHRAQSLNSEKTMNKHRG